MEDPLAEGAEPVALEEVDQEVDPGMNKEQVLNLLGAPGDRQFEGAQEAWQYCKTSVWGSTDR